MFIAVIITIIILCICCLSPSCLYYYNESSHATSTTIAAQQAPQVLTMVTTITDTKYQQVPPIYVPDPGNQLYPTEAPPPAGYYNY